MKNIITMRKLPRNFFARDTHVVAKELLGKILVRTWRGRVSSGRICEVESYVGENDKACHASKGKTKRNEVMWGEAGYAYVYLIYGMYDCLNLVTEKKDFPAAVLIRGLVPIEGIALMKKWRGQDDEKNLSSGPGKLTQALKIDRKLSGEDITRSSRLQVVSDGYTVKPREIKCAERIGVDYAGEDAKLLWRYFIKI